MTLLSVIKVILDLFVELLSAMKRQERAEEEQSIKENPRELFNKGNPAALGDRTAGAKGNKSSGTPDADDSLQSDTTDNKQ